MKIRQRGTEDTEKEVSRGMVGLNPTTCAQNLPQCPQCLCGTIFIRHLGGLAAWRLTVPFVRRETSHDGAMRRFHRPGRHGLSHGGPSCPRGPPADRVQPPPCKSATLGGE